MQNFNYERKYDCIWIQWVALYLTDQDLLDYLINSRNNLAESTEIGPNGKNKCGLIFVKENVSRDRFLIDKQDNSVMRTKEQFDALFEDAGLEILTFFYQKGFPEELYPIACYVLKKK